MHELCNAGEVKKRSFISTVRSIVHTNPSRKRTELFENRRNLKLLIFRFHVDWKHYGDFRGLWRLDNHVILISPSFPRTQIHNDQWLLGFLNSYRACVDAKHLSHFRSEPFAFKFLCGVEWKEPWITQSQKKTKNNNNINKINYELHVSNETSLK